MRLSADMPSNSVESALCTAWPAKQWSEVTILAAVSGGPDSVALLRALHRLRPDDAAGRVVVAHFNHRWRGAESDGDEAFVLALATSLGLVCEVGRADSKPTNASEELARNERYAFLLQTAHRVGSRFVVVGHTADDQAETILFRLVRGTGLSGLAGMPQARALSAAVTLFRPLLSVRRAAVLEYLHHLGQPFRTDASNSDVRYARNRLRREVLPQLQEMSERDVVEHLLQLGHQAAEIVQPIQRAASESLDRVIENSATGVVLQFDRLGELPSRPVLREMFVELWRRQGWPRGEMTSRRWDELAEAVVSGTSPERMFPSSLRAQLTGGLMSIGRLMQ
jgi:tRNA(Ile)-lysidine synthase